MAFLNGMLFHQEELIKNKNMKIVKYIVLIIILSSLSYSQPIFRSNGAIITTKGDVFVRVENLPVKNSASTGITTTKGELILKDNARFKVNEAFTSELDCKITTNDNSNLYVLKDLDNSGPINLYGTSIIAIIQNLINAGPINNLSQIEIGQ